MKKTEKNQSIKQKEEICTFDLNGQNELVLLQTLFYIQLLVCLKYFLLVIPLSKINGSNIYFGLLKNLPHLNFNIQSKIFTSFKLFLHMNFLHSHDLIKKQLTD